MRLAPQHLLSLSRLVLGAYVLGELLATPRSFTVLPTIVLACVADYCDGIVARRVGVQTVAGRLLDNCCDAGFLALAFAGFGGAHIWSASLPESLSEQWRALDWLPLLALFASFGSYALRWLVAAAHGALPRPSAPGHHAGIANYVLAVTGGVAVLPAFMAPPFVLESVFILVVLLNVIAAMDNLKLLASGQSDAVHAA